MSDTPKGHTLADLMIRARQMVDKYRRTAPQDRPRGIDELPLFASEVIALAELATRHHDALEVPRGLCLEMSMDRLAVRLLHARNRVGPEVSATANDWLERETVIRLAMEALKWRENVEAMLSDGDPDVVRVHEGGGPEDLIASLAVTMLKTRRERDARVRSYSKR